MTNTKHQLFNRRLHIYERIIQNITRIILWRCECAQWLLIMSIMIRCVTWICKSNKHVHKYLCTSMTGQTVWGWAYRAHVNQTTHRDWIIHEKSRVKRPSYWSHHTVCSHWSRAPVRGAPWNSPGGLRSAGQLAVIHAARSVRRRLPSAPQAHADAGTHPMHA